MAVLVQVLADQIKFPVMRQTENTEQTALSLTFIRSLSFVALFSFYDDCPVKIKLRDGSGMREVVRGGRIDAVFLQQVDYPSAHRQIMANQ